MTFYADDPVRRGRQIVGDVLVLLWVATWVLLGKAVHDQVARLAGPGRTIESAGSSLEEGLRAAGEGVAGVPLLGEELRAPFDAAGIAAGSLTQAGLDIQESVSRAAVVAGVSTALWPVLLVLGWWLWRRLRFARRASAAQALLRDGADLDLFALRALTRLPLTTLARVSADPAGDWRRGDPEVVRTLARLELADVGLRVPPSSSASSSPART